MAFLDLWWQLTFCFLEIPPSRFWLVEARVRYSKFASSASEVSSASPPESEYECGAHSHLYTIEIYIWHTMFTYSYCFERLRTKTRNKLIVGGYYNFEMLPNSAASPAWKEIRDKCNLEFVEFVEVTNVRFGGEIYWDGEFMTSFLLITFLLTLYIIFFAIRQLSGGYLCQNRHCYTTVLGLCGRLFWRDPLPIWSTKLHWHIRGLING